MPEPSHELLRDSCCQSGRAMAGLSLDGIGDHVTARSIAKTVLFITCITRLTVAILQPCLNRADFGLSGVR